MPPRYQQNQLASQVVGTPGLDRSAGQASFAAARAIDEMTTTANQLAIQNGRQAQQSLESAGNALMYYGEKQAAEQRRQAAIAKAEADEQRKLQVQFDLLDENDRMDKVIGDLKTKYAANPEGALEAFNQQIPQMREDFQGRYGADEKRLRMLMPAQRHSENAAQTHLAAWAKETINANLNARLAALPEELGQKIDNLEGSVPEQLLEFQRQLIPVNQVYQNMQDSAVSEADRIEIQTKRMNMGTDSGRRFTDHLLAQTPEGEDGLKHLDTVRGIVENAKRYGLPLKSSDQKTIMEQIHSQRSAREGEVITGIKAESDLRLLDTNRLKAKLYQAADNPSELNRLATQVQGRFQELDKQIEMVGKEPDSKIRNAKLAGLKSEQNSLITEMGLDLKLVRSFEQLQRTLVSFARSTTTFNQGQLKFQNYLADRTYSLEQRAIRADEKAANEARAARLDGFNKKWAGIAVDMQSALSQPMGAKQQEAISKVLREKAIPELNAAVQTGLINGNAYEAKLNALKGTAETASLSKMSDKWQFGPFSGGGEVKPLKGKEKEKAIQQARQGVARAISDEQSNFRALGQSVDQLSSLTRSKAEKAYLTDYLYTNLPRVFKSAKYRAMSEQDKAAARAKFTKAAITNLRNGTLK